MANMSYCRFQNTSNDLEDCLDSLRNHHPLDSGEYYAALGMFKSFLDFCQNQCIISEYDWDQLHSYLQDQREKEEEE